ncbi:MAG: type 2 isopentenyl-diphosphate Delta-isomerase [Anaerolineales bacterium]|nr:type 2 isopentenyl-diphosphate Delta-isomerase [Anaerolineales bacterium]MCL4258068.1 type 2 isopentenyl-diphosphate Delta-isomerase [Anaerolineales bacterium]
MAKVTGTGARKADHIRINLEEDVRSGLTTGFEKYSFLHNALPELDLAEVDLAVQVFGKQLKSPILISSMTGGTDEAGQINQALAEAAQETGIALGLGSQRAAIEDPKLETTFRVRNVAPDILLFANVGAVQLNYGYGLNHLQRAVDMAEADALMLHLNAVQEAVQPEGDTNFSGLLKKIEIMCKQLPVPVVVKEVGWGISGELAKQLARAGVQAIDVAGAGGTSWSQVEMHRAKNPSQARLAAAFVDWGIPTAESIMQVRQAVKTMRIFASGGLRSGVDIAKGIALGAELGGMAGPFLKAAVKSSKAVVETINEVSRELQVAMFAAGAGSISALQAVPLIYRGD